MGLGGQLRIMPGGAIGWDMTAALAMASALGIASRLAADLLPHLESVMVTKLNEQIRTENNHV